MHLAVGAVCDRPRSRSPDCVGGHRPPLQLSPRSRVSSHPSEKPENHKEQCDWLPLSHRLETDPQSMTVLRTLAHPDFSMGRPHACVWYLFRVHTRGTSPCSKCVPRE